MNNTEATKLMHAVLDGGASPEERSALERALAADPQLREEFDGLRRMFAGLDAVPRYDPPPGFAERVVALQRSMAVGDPARQLFSHSGVIGPSGKDISVRNPSVNATRPRTPSESIWGNWQMAMSKRGMWIVGGVAAAVAAMFIGGVVDFPPSGEKATGTIAPAKKAAKGEQPGAADLKRPTSDATDDARKPKSEPGQAGGVGSTAGGGGNAASAVGSTAGGGGNAASAVGSTAGGGGNAASAVGSTAGGGGNAASAVGSTAGGGGNAASAVGNSAGAVGNSASAVGNSASAVGNSAGAVGNSASAVGNSASAVGNSASAVGNSASAVGNAASAVGNAAGSAVGAAEAKKK
jgi:hypothetical protein